MIISIKYGDFAFVSKSGFPTPKVTIDTSYNRTQSQQYLGAKQTINLEGIIYNHRMADQYSTSNNGTSSSSGLLAKAIELKKNLLYKDEPKLFTISAGALSMVSGSGYISSINFDTSNDRAVNKIDYTIVIDLYDTRTGLSPSIADNTGIYNLVSVQDSLEIDTNLDQVYSNDLIQSSTSVLFPTYTISRTIGAVGHRGHSGALYEAAKWINDRQSKFPITDVIPTSTFPLFNFTRSLDINESQGSINIRDNFLSRSSGKPYIDKYSVNTSISEDFIREIKINGNIQGLYRVVNLSGITGIVFDLSKSSGQNMLYPLLSGYLDTGNMKYRNALSGYTDITGIMYNRALVFDRSSKNLVYDSPQFSSTFSNYKNAPLHNIPLSITEGINPVQGTIDYSYSFNSRPLAIISGALVETVTINESGPTPRIANIPVLGRRLGPVVYFYTSSSGHGEKTVSYEGVFTSPTGLKKLSISKEIIQAVDNYVKSYAPKPPFTGLITSNQNNINLNENRIRKTITWQYTKCANG